MTKNLPTLLFLSVLATLVAGLFPFPAFAAEDTCSYVTGINTIFCGMTAAFKSSPMLLSMISWIIAVIMAITALINLKEYGDDPSRTPLKNIIIKLLIAVLLISLPLIMKTIGSTMASGGSGATMTRPMLGRGSIGGKAN